MLQQYSAIKAQHEDAILLFRLGDFYELFFEDAQKAAPILGVALTKRGYANGDPVPMCGVPYHASDLYISKLLKADLKVAICDQIESAEEAKKRGASAIVTRDVVRIVTPGTVVEENLISTELNNYLASMYFSQGMWSVATCDLSTGKFVVTECSPMDLENVVGCARPKEILISTEDAASDDVMSLLRALGSHITIQPKAFFHYTAMCNALKKALNVSDLSGLGSFSEKEVCAAGAVAQYMTIVYKDTVVQLGNLKRDHFDDCLVIDYTTMNSLEFFETQKGQKKGSLFQAINATSTPGGGRLLAQHMMKPMALRSTIEAQINAVEFLVNNSSLAVEMPKMLRHLGDIERILTRIVMGRFSPRDVGSVQVFLQKVEEIAEWTDRLSSVLFCDIQSAVKNMPLSLLSTLNKALNEELPNGIQDGGVIKAGFDEGLDEVRDLKKRYREKLACLEKDYVSETGVGSLRLRENKSAQIYIEVNKKHANMLPPKFVQQQTMTNAVRFMTEELQDLQNTLNAVDERVYNQEFEVYCHVVEAILSHRDALIRLSHIISAFDVQVSHALTALRFGYSKPEITDEALLKVDQGWHPTVQMMLHASQKFVKNSCNLEKHGLMMVTGPNMGGKSTYLRQNALIILLAHMGAYVPAQSAVVGLCDRLFSRVGAGDDLTRGRSTFMVEMLETAAILNCATEKSFVILDEVGRGTATHDGLSLAMAITEYLHTHIKSRALFATHYHEMAEIAERYEDVSNVHASVREWKGKLIFEYKILPGAASKSYGIMVAAQACVPTAVTQRAAQILLSLQDQSIQPLPQQKDLSVTFTERPEVESVQDWLATIDVNNLTPKQALDLLFDKRAKTSLKN